MYRKHPCLAILCILAIAQGCSTTSKDYQILGSIEDPQNELALAIATVLNQTGKEKMTVRPGIGSLASLDSLEQGKADFGIVDNCARYSDRVTSVMPLYPQVLHILHRRYLNSRSLKELMEGHKVFAGLPASGTYHFVDQLIADFNIDRKSVYFVDIVDFFQAEVIFSFTDLLTNDELMDLKEYKLFSIDLVDNLGKGSLAESICTRHPQFQPYVISRDLYGDFSEGPVLTVAVDAVLVCRSNLKADLIFGIIKVLHENRRDIISINPLLHHFSGDFNPERLTYRLHEGARNYLDRYEPTFVERHAELLSVVVTVILALASAFYTVSQWQRAKKKNKIDVYYKKLMSLRGEVFSAHTAAQVVELDKSLRVLQEETVELVIKEKLMADESFSIFLNLCTIVTEEMKWKAQQCQ